MCYDAAYVRFFVDDEAESTPSLQRMEKHRLVACIVFVFRALQRSMELCNSMYVDSRFVCTVNRSQPWRDGVDAFHGKYSEPIRVN